MCYKMCLFNFRCGIGSFRRLVDWVEVQNLRRQLFNAIHLYNPQNWPALENMEDLKYFPNFTHTRACISGDDRSMVQVIEQGTTEAQFRANLKHHSRLSADLVVLRPARYMQQPAMPENFSGPEEDLPKPQLAKRSQDTRVANVSHLNAPKPTVVQQGRQKAFMAYQERLQQGFERI